MSYTFEILGVLPILQLFMFNQQASRRSGSERGVEYISARQCTLDAFLDPIEEVTQNPSWDLDQIVQAAINFWVNHPESVQLWKDRLDRSSGDTVLVARVGSLRALQQEFEWMLGLQA